jgi:hypothetical protein
MNTSEILLRLFELETLIGDLCEIAREKGHQRKAVQLLLSQENEIMRTFNEAIELIDPDARSSSWILLPTPTPSDAKRPP